MNLTRTSGILLHPTSLPGTPGIGTLGKPSFAFIDFLAASHCHLWQMLPLGPTGYGDSPYQSFSTFAGNPLLIDFSDLVSRGWARSKDCIAPSLLKSAGIIDYGSVVSWKIPVLQKCADFFAKNASETDYSLFELFCKENSFWLNDYAVFMSLKVFFDNQAAEKQSMPVDAEKNHESGKVVNSMWNRYWPELLAAHNLSAVDEWSAHHFNEISMYKIVQFFFFVQWEALHSYAHEHGVSFIGDIPIFVASDSADVWAHQSLFQLDGKGVPEKVAGVPPDYFSPTGQLWGNPLYNWAAMKKEGFSWWTARIAHALSRSDFVRIDHFRGFESYWSIPYGSKTAVNGTWQKGPGKDFFDTVHRTLGEMPIIAEDLGVITDRVRKLRDDCGFPGMKVLQFAFSHDEEKTGALVNQFLPHMYDSSCVVYTGTHDNDTTQGWLLSLDQKTRSLVASYVTGRRCSEKEVIRMLKNGMLCRLLIREAFASTAWSAIIPFQDLYGLGNEARMNTPSTSGKNWTWRMSARQLSGSVADRVSNYLAALNMLYNRGR